LYQGWCLTRICPLEEIIFGKALLIRHPSRRGCCSFSKDKNIRWAVDFESCKKRVGGLICNIDTRNELRRTDDMDGSTLPLERCTSWEIGKVTVPETATLIIINPRVIRKRRRIAIRSGIARIITTWGKVSWVGV